jgi:hypothetical protein
MPGWQQFGQSFSKKKVLDVQVLALHAKGIKAAYLGSSQKDEQVKRDAWLGKYDIVYMSPELACNSLDNIVILHNTRKLCGVAIDEVGHVHATGVVGISYLSWCSPGRTKADVSCRSSLHIPMKCRCVAGFCGTVAPFC